MDWEISAAEKGGYEHFMFKEIMEQPKALRDTIFPRIRDGQGGAGRFRPRRRDDLREAWTSCTSSPAAPPTMWAWRPNTPWSGCCASPVEVTLASEFRYCDPIVTREHPGRGHQPVRRDHRHPGRHAGGPAAGRRGCCPSSMWWGPPSPGSRTTCIYTWAGPEIAVATTKAYSTQLAVVYLLGLYFAELLGTVEPGGVRRHGRRAELLIPTKMEEILRSSRRRSSTMPLSTSTTTPCSSSAGTSTMPWGWRAP